MKYFAKDINGTQHGPLSGDELSALVKQGLVSAECPVKKDIIPGWIKAADLPFLQLCLQETDSLAKKDVKEKKAEPLNTESENKTTVLNTRLIPVHAGLLLRIYAALYDFIFLAVVFLILAGIATVFAQTMFSASDGESASIRKTLQKRKAHRNTDTKNNDQNDKLNKNAASLEQGRSKIKDSVKRRKDPTVISDEVEGFHAGSVWLNKESGQLFVCLSAKEGKAVWCRIQNINSLAVCVLSVFFVFAMFRLFVPLAFRAQTKGMRYFGIFISDAKDPLKEVLELRASAAYLLSLLTCVTTPFFLLFRKQTIAEKITGTKIIRISSRKD